MSNNLFWLDIKAGDTFIVSDNKYNSGAADLFGKRYKVINVERGKYKTKIAVEFLSGEIENWEGHNNNIYYNDQLTK